MKLKKTLTIFALSGLLLTGALFVGKGAEEGAKVARATTDFGEIAISEVQNNVSSASAMYILPSTVSELPKSWDYRYATTAEDEGVFINGVKNNNPDFKYVDMGQAVFYYGLPSAASDGDKVEFKGTFTRSDAEYSFSIHYVAQRFADKWVNELEDYDVISLKDANMPDFEYVTINTEDDPDYGYIAYDKGEYAKKVITKRKGIFGYTNGTQSFAFEFNFEVNGKMSDWVDIRLGASGGWDTGHFLQFRLTNQYNGYGTVIGKECVNGNVCGTNTKEVYPDISDGVRHLSMGSIKLKGYENKYFVFFKNNDVVALGEYWDLASTYRSTKVGIYHAQADVKITNITNTVTPEETKLNLSAISTPSGIYFNTEKDVLPIVNSWGDYFIPQSADAFTYNGEDAYNEQINYFKKVGATSNSFYLGLGDLHITPAAGDMFHLGGIFKLASYKGEEKITVVYKVVIKDCDFQFDGEAWHAINPNYKASDFAKDLLKMTLSICTGVGGNNHDALEGVWATLSGSEYYGMLAIDEKNTLGSAIGSGAIVVPSTSSGVDAMSDENALAAAMYRYDYCTSKYSLTNFIEGRSVASNNSILIISKISSGNVMQVVTITVSILLVTGLVVAYFVFRKKEDK